MTRVVDSPRFTRRMRASRFSSCTAIIVPSALMLIGVRCTSASCEQLNTCGPCADLNYAYSHPQTCPGVLPLLEAGASDAATEGDATAETSDAAEEIATEAEAGASCDGTKAPSEDPCVIDERFGVFVSASASVVGSGTKRAPYKTIAQGIANAHGKNVYVCGGTYPEAVAIDASSDGARVFGGFDCGTWTYATSERPKVRPASAADAGADASTSAAVIPLTIRGLATGVVIEDMEFDAPAAIASGESSIAAFVVSSKGVALTHVKLVASSGQPGADAPPSVSNYDTNLLRTDAKIAGQNATRAMGGAAQTCASLCAMAPAVASRGGKGGNGGAGGDAGAPSAGEDGTPAIDVPDGGAVTGKGGAAQPDVNGMCLNGTRGANAPPAAGGLGAANAGTPTSAGWMPADGAPGATGAPGQGGGGGGGGIDPDTMLGGGGGGACGGCGGAGGAGGQGGGSSFALLSVQSTVTLDACELVADAAGKGGKGADGQAGQVGGAGGTPASLGCLGGAGGQGGQGGGGGGGAGGLSVAIAYVGAAPSANSDTTTMVASMPASGGAAGMGGSPASSKGADGKAQARLDLSSATP